MLQSRSTTSKHSYNRNHDTSLKDFGVSDNFSMGKVSTTGSSNRSLHFQHKDFKLPEIKKTEMNVRIRGALMLIV